MAEIGNVTVRVDAVITDEQYHEAMSAVSAANEYIAALEAENAKLRELAARALGLFLKHGAVHPCDLPEVDAIMDESRELGIEVES